MGVEGWREGCFPEIVLGTPPKHLTQNKRLDNFTRHSFVTQVLTLDSERR